MVSELYNQVFTSDAERAVLNRLFNTFFKLPLYMAQQQKGTGKPPTLAEISEQFALRVPGEADVLLRIMQSDPRIPHFMTRNPVNGEIMRVDVDEIMAHPRFGKLLERSIAGWEGRPAPAFDVKSYDGTPLSSAELAGKPYLLYFWFTNCPPCVRTSPLLAELDRTYAARGFRIVGLNADRVLELPYGDDERRDYAAKQGLGFTLAHLTPAVQEAYGSVSVFPTFFFVDREGHDRQAVREPAGQGRARGRHPAGARVAAEAPRSVATQRRGSRAAPLAARDGRPGHGRRHHGRLGDLPHARPRRRAARAAVAHLRGLGARRPRGAAGRARLRRARDPAPAARAASTSYAREAFGRRAAFVVGLDRGARHLLRGDRRDRRGERRVPGAPPRLAARARAARSECCSIALFTGLNLVGVERRALDAEPRRRGARCWRCAAVVVVAGVCAAAGAGWSGRLPDAPTGLASLGALAVAFQSVIWSYYGYPDVAKIAEEVKDPDRRLPRIFLVGILGTTGLYLLLNAAFLQRAAARAHRRLDAGGRAT